ncbi:MAG: hypothetical protein LBF01_01000, partial [Bacteroidales bacterium]|nr:hypothetical protein [Bacteroidales bacterium]
MDSEFKIKFDGQQHQIEANVLINNLIHTSTIIQELNRELNTGKKIEIKIKALEKGSFLVHIDLIQGVDAVRNIFTRENLTFAAEIIGGIYGIIGIYKFLKGKKIKSKKENTDGTIRIENVDGDVNVFDNFVVNIYENNVTIKDAISQSFETLENEPSIDGYEILDKDEKPFIRVDRSEFEYLSIKSEEIEADEKIVKIAATLNIVRVSFDTKLAWEFYYKGIKISAKVNDTDFQNRIDDGEAFSKGDVLQVELEIRQKFDTTVNTYINKSYKVNKIIEHTQR